MRQSNLGLEIDGPWTRFQCKHFSSQHSSTTPATENKGKARTKRLKADSIQIHSASFYSIQPCTGIAQGLGMVRTSTFGCACLKLCVIFTLLFCSCLSSNPSENLVGSVFKTQRPTTPHPHCYTFLCLSPCPCQGISAYQPGGCS